MFTLKKSLGQHFLKDEIICKKVVDALKPLLYKNLLEVGPGGGALTKYLVQQKDISFKAVELDEEKAAYLVKAFPSLNNHLIVDSILDMKKPFDEEFAIIGNFPYNISSQILFKAIKWKEDITGMVGMFQKEVAQRVAAKEGSKVYGVTSVLVQAFFQVDYLFEVDENSFTPPPKVKSAVIRLMPKTISVDIKSEKKLFLLVKTAFNQRRKTLRNAVKGLFEPGILQEELFNKRAEQLSVEDFAALTFRMN